MLDDTFSGKDLTAAKTLLRTMAPRGDAEAWKAAKDYIFSQGGEVAGHGINDAGVVTSVTEDGAEKESVEPAALFEFRSLPTNSDSTCRSSGRPRSK